MLVAIDQHGNKVSPITKTIDEIKFLSNCKVLYCSECEKPVTFYSGQKQVPHFRHDRILNCIYESEPETKEHIEGKMLIYNWLKELLPEAQVEMEYKILETNQRADVIAILSNGKRIVVEMQCSKILGNEWLDRHNLYKSAGIQDIWILGNSVHNYGITNSEIDEEKHKLNSLSEAVFKQFKSLFFLNSVSGEIKAIYPFNFFTRMSSLVIISSEERFRLKDSMIRGNLIGTNECFQSLLEWKEKIKAKKLDEEKRRKEHELQILKEKEERKKVLLREEQLNAEIKTNRSTYLRYTDVHFELLYEKMTAKEKALFERLCKKHNLNAKNFPGFLNIYTIHDYLIETPRQVWQLYLYDRYLYQKEKVWLDSVKDDFWKFKKSGLFRIKYNKESEVSYSFAIYDYIYKLGQTGYLTQLGWRPKYQRINCKELPTLTDFKVNQFVSLYVSSFERSDYETSSHLYEEYVDFHRNGQIANEIKETYYVYKAMLEIEHHMVTSSIRIDPAKYLAHRDTSFLKESSSTQNSPSKSMDIVAPVVKTTEDLMKIHKEQLDFVRSKEDKISQGLQKGWTKITNILSEANLPPDFAYSSFKVELINLYNSVINR